MAGLKVGRREIRRRWGYTGAGLTLVALLLFMIVGAGAVLAPKSTFEGDDGNMLVNGVAPAKDWANVNPAKFVDASGNTDDSITGGANGGKEDVEYPFLTTGSVPPKTDLTDIALKIERSGGDDFLYAASIRKAPNGSANLNFELNKGTEGVSPNGVTPTRMQGDKLITFDFTSGGRNADINALTWHKTSGDCYDPQATRPCWGAFVDLDGVGYAEGAANDGQMGRSGALTAAENTISNVAISANQFQEMAINLNDAGILPRGTCETFRSVTTKSRSSGNSFLSSLKDIHVASQTITNCGSLTIIKDADPNDAQDFGFTSTSTTATSVGSFSLDDDSDSTLPDRQRFDNLLPGTYTVTEAEVSGWDLHSIVCDTGGSGNTQTRTATIEVAVGEHVTCTFTNRARGSIKIVKVTDPNPDPTDTSFEFTPGGGLGTTAFSLKNGGEKVYANLAPGSNYSVAETVPSGWDLTSATCTNGTIGAIVVLGGAETVCTFTNRKRAQVDIVKVDDANSDPQLSNRLNGATFTLYTDVSNAPGAPVGSAVANPNNCTTSGSGLDAGKCSIANIVPGTYWLVETTTPAGYSTAASQKVVLAAGADLTRTFVDPRKHKVIVLVCHEGTNDLAPSQVTNGSSAETSIGSVPSALADKGVTQADLCGIGGASFGGLGHGDKNVTADVGGH